MRVNSFVAEFPACFYINDLVFCFLALQLWHNSNFCLIITFRKKKLGSVHLMERAPSVYCLLLSLLKNQLAIYIDFIHFVKCSSLWHRANTQRSFHFLTTNVELHFQKSLFHGQIENTIIKIFQLLVCHLKVYCFMLKVFFICSLFSLFVIMLSFNTGINLPLLNKAAAF